MNRYLALLFWLYKLHKCGSPYQAAQHQVYLQFRLRNRANICINAICFTRHACCLQAEWNFLLRGGSSLTPISSDAATPSWLSGSQWSQMVQMGRAVPALQGVADSMSMPSESLAWEEWAGCTKPHLQPLPTAWEPVCTTFHRLLLLKVCDCQPRQHRMHAVALTTSLTMTSQYPSRFCYTLCRLLCLCSFYAVQHSIRPVLLCTDLFCPVLSCSGLVCDCIIVITTMLSSS